MEKEGLKPITIAIKDPIRYPKIQVPLERQAKVFFEVRLNEMFVDLTKQLVKAAK